MSDLSGDAAEQVSVQPALPVSPCHDEGDTLAVCDEFPAKRGLIGPANAVSRMNDPPAEPDSSVDAETEREDRDGDPGTGFVEVRSALVGLGLIWLTAFAAFGAIVAAVYGLTVSVEYLLVSAVAAVVAVVAAAASLRTFGYR